MSISYSGLTNYGRVNLPSVEGWGTSMNILKDPPKSLMTRRRNKVGQTASITEDIDAAGDRAAEAIRVFARGTNPSVSVMYNNIGTAGGQTTCLEKSGSLLTEIQTGFTETGAPRMKSVAGAMARNTTTMASLPYKIMQGGAFRPPVLNQAQTLPLSRQARASTAAFTMPGFADFSKKLRVVSNAYKTREVKDTLVTLHATSAKTKKRLSQLAPHNIKHKIIDTTLMQGKNAETNKCEKRVYKSKGTLNTAKFINKKCRRPVEVGYTKSSQREYKRTVKNFRKAAWRNVPISTWAGAAVAKMYVPDTRTYKLPQTLSKGGFDGRAQLPNVTATEMVGQVKCGNDNIAWAASQLPLADAVKIQAAGACGGPKLTQLRSSR